MLYTKYVDELASDLNVLRNELRSFMISSNITKIKLSADMGVNGRTLYKFLKGDEVLTRTAWKIAHYLEKHLQKH